ncbi:hypothetical protein CTheo_8739 [Ceratobasidium theobromae]|uniref:Uncharacterized protein n=1 Tax=Ceratobasidium theobromae TaxID=1582974 RepID=A0A5N5Q8S2_9AGAM|nr:hypothetical protein CTheo_8739 [Ceratobasidium theobromae]
MIIIVETLSLIQEGCNVLKAGPFKADETAHAEPIDFKAILTDSKHILNTNFLLDYAHNAHKMCPMLGLDSHTHLYPYSRSNITQLAHLRFTFHRGCWRRTHVKGDENTQEHSKEWDDEETWEELCDFLSSVNPTSTQNPVPNAPDVILVMIVHNNEKELHAFWVSQKIVRPLQNAMQGYIICHNHWSLNNNGQQLLDLKPKCEIISWIVLDKATEDAIAEAAMEHAECSTNPQADMEAFYTGVKKILVHPLLKDASSVPHAWLEKQFPDIAAYEAKSSAKIDWLL